MKGHYAGKSHPHRDEKTEQRKRGYDDDLVCYACADPDHAEVVIDSLGRARCARCAQELPFWPPERP
jgi:hypothetical protein